MCKLLISCIDAFLGSAIKLHPFQTVPAIQQPHNAHPALTIAQVALFSGTRPTRNHKNPIRAATNTRNDMHEYGRHSLTITESFLPTPLCATSPCFIIVAVAAGTSVTVIGPVGVVPVGGPIVVGPVAVMQPFGEHKLFIGQHPPPSSAKHSRYEGRHVGSAVQELSHANSVSFKLQQYIFDGVSGVGWQDILTGQQISYALSNSAVHVRSWRNVLTG